MRRSLGCLAACFLLSVFPAFAQDPEQPPPPPPDPVVEQPPAQTAPKTEQEELEEEHIRSRMENGDSHASGGRPELGPVVLGNPTAAVALIRVGLNTTTFNANGTVATEFSSLHHTFVELSNTDGAVKVINRADGKEILEMWPGMRIRVEHDGLGFLVSQDGVLIGSFEGPVLFRPTTLENLFRVEHIRRVFGGTKVPTYRGAMEVGRGSTTKGLPPPFRVNLYNIIEVEDYVPGVVANESIASFAIEALKAQAVAARGYAIANVGNYIARGYPFDIVDSSSSQVYRGVISEHVNAVSASSETRGLVASSNGQIISALYSSSFGGHSENNEWIFPSPSSALPGSNAASYLRGIYDGFGSVPDFSGDIGIDAFWRTQQPDTYDSCAQVNNRFSRWAITIPAATIKARLPGRYVLVSGSSSTVLNGSITDVQVITRMAASARIAVARILLTTGAVDVKGWDNLRFVLGRTAFSTPLNCGSAVSASFTLNNPSSLAIVRNPDGTVNAVTAYGGGWGHNLGMSQYGAHGRGKLGQSFIEILKAYYTGTDVGTSPIDIGRVPGSGPPTLRQTFVAPNAQGTLEIRATDLKGLRVHLNELYDLTFDEAALAAGVLSVDVSDYLVAGLNVIQYNPVGRDGTATVNVIVR